MGEMKHTPGPWVITEPFRVVPGIPVCEVRRPNYAGYTVSSVSITDDPSQNDAISNARLISAVPDLCAVAESVVAADQSDLGVIDLLLELKRIARSARAALSKAEGRSLSSASGQEGGEA